MVIKVLVISENPVKIQAARDAFSIFFTGSIFDTFRFRKNSSEGIYLKSQPIGEAETRLLSRQRVIYARDLNPKFNFYVGIEGGVAQTPDNQPRIVSYSSIGNHSIIETVKACEIPIPLRWYKKLTGVPPIDLGDLVSKISGISNIKQKEGAVGFLTRNIVTRFDILKQSVLMALIPFLNPIHFELTVE